MAAPLLIIPAAFAALLAGAHLAPWIAGAGGALTVADSVTADLDKLCQATDPLLDALADRHKNARWLDDLARAADRICAAAAGGPGIATDFRLVAATLQAIGSAQAELQNDAVVAPAANAAGRKKVKP
jgi:hypothetical protein